MRRDRCWVIKVGSSLVTNHGVGLDPEAIRSWVRQIAELRQQGIDVVLVSSGAVAEGLVRLGWKKRPSALHELQAAAAVGQMGLVQQYESCFSQHGLHTAQVLLTHDDLSHRTRYLNARSTLRTLLDIGVVPIVNENDTVVNDEIKFGDNDTLGALVTNLIEAEILVILTDQKGMYTGDPTLDPTAVLIEKAEAGDEALLSMAGGGKPGSLGRGGMYTKVLAAARAARSGASTVIAYGRRPGILQSVANQEIGIGTWLMAEQEPMAARKRWMAGYLQFRGSVKLDAGAVNVLRNKGSSLLAVGVVAVSGDFKRGEVVQCLGPDGLEVARGLINYSAEEARKIAGKPSDEIARLLGYVGEPELIHRDNLVVM
ncbi:MAG: glutamate 5-kinase [Gammaproteobacteria bacterium]|nr:glutamate 5-kinase [Gammaproteobacteria bacterium]